MKLVNKDGSTSEYIPGGIVQGPLKAVKIGIGISVHNRHEVFAKTFEQIWRYAPNECKIAIVDDCSDIPLRIAKIMFIDREIRHYRFEKNAGIAAVKNKCFELLDDCDHIFLFDDDMYPIVENWWKPYVESREPHLMYIFEDFVGPTKVNDTATLWNDGQIKAFSHCRGVMCYFDRKCLDIVGGMDTAYGRWGWEHPDLSNRIYNAGLTRWKYADVVGSEKLFYCMDEHRAVRSTVLGLDRHQQIARNRPIYEKRKNSKAFIPWKPGAVQNVPRGTDQQKRDIILTSYFTGVPDPQGVRRSTDPMQILMELSPLVSTCIKNGAELFFLHDNMGDREGVFERDTERGRWFMSKTKALINPYFQRWASYRDHLITYKESIGRVFCVDATDVEMLQNPFPHMQQNTLYTGDEPDKVGHSVWLQNHHRHPTLRTFMQQYANRPLLNAGLLGGDVETVIDFCGKMMDFYAQAEEDSKFKRWPNAGMTDMATFNYVAYTHFAGKISHGSHVNTVFKAYEKDNKTAFFKHK